MLNGRDIVMTFDVYGFGSSYYIIVQVRRKNASWTRGVCSCRCTCVRAGSGVQLSGVRSVQRCL